MLILSRVTRGARQYGGHRGLHLTHTAAMGNWFVGVFQSKDWFRHVR